MVQRASLMLWIVALGTSMMGLIALSIVGAVSTLKIDDFSVHTDAKGTVHVSKDGVDLTTMEKLTYEIQ